MFNKHSQPGLRLAFWVGVSLALMIFDGKYSQLQRVRSLLEVPLSFLQYSVSVPVNLIRRFDTVITSHHSLVKENFDLKAEQLLLRSQVQRLLALEAENVQLKALLHSTSRLPGKVLVAELMSLESDPFVNQVLINKGSQDKVYIGQPVIDANGLMGKIIQISAFTSRALLITDNLSGVPVQNNRNGVRAIAVGDSYTGRLHLVNVPVTTDIKPGDILLTSGLGENYPMGYPVGRVLTFNKDPALPFAKIDVQPLAQLDRSNEVLLIWPDQPSPFQGAQAHA